MPGTCVPFVVLRPASPHPHPGLWDWVVMDLVLGKAYAQRPTIEMLSAVKVLSPCVPSLLQSYPVLPSPGADMDPNPRAALERQQLRLRERQKFFEDILQPDAEFVFPLSHLHLESHRRKF